MLQFLGASAYWNYYIMGIIIIPGIILGIYAQHKVNATYDTYSVVMNKSGRTASEVARIMLNAAGCSNVSIAKISGHLTDNYNHRKQTVSLSSSVHDSTSVASIGIAAHEVGHVLQYKTHYLPIKLRSFAITASNISSSMLLPLIILGLVFNFLIISSIGNIMIWAGIIVFGLSVLVNLVTLPVEYNASRRATAILKESGLLDEEESLGAKKVLNAAALTYVAALVISLLELLRFILAVKSSND